MIAPETVTWTCDRQNCTETATGVLPGVTPDGWLTDVALETNSAFAVNQLGPMCAVLPLDQVLTPVS